MDRCGIAGESLNNGLIQSNKKYRLRYRSKMASAIITITITHNNNDGILPRILSLPPSLPPSPPPPSRHNDS